MKLCTNSDFSKPKRLIYSHELTDISATNCFMHYGNHQATKMVFVLFSVGMINQNKWYHPDNFRAH